jgi:hypothetical protein
MCFEWYIKTRSPKPFLTHFWISGLPDYRIAKLLDCWIAGLLDCWIAGLHQDISIK